jgi:mannose-1-phosphate guanylyltransferase/mannose-6-phosphate isomerase
MRLIPVILCGGAGKRLWPESREAFPKQFLAIEGRRSIFRATLDRLVSPGADVRPVVVTNEALRFLVLDEIEQAGLRADIVLEPSRRDTGPAIGAALALIASRSPDAVVGIFPSDHYIGDESAFAAAVTEAVAVADQGHIVTFGITATEPSTAYGYIEPGEPIAGSRARQVRRFVEKPDGATAERYVADGYLWNGGMFFGRSEVLAGELAAHEPGLAEAVTAAVARGTVDGAFLRLDPRSFENATRKSFDYAVMERTRRAAVLPVDFGWSDIGSWDAVLEVSHRDARGNAVKGDVVVAETSGSIVRSERALTAVLGMKDVVVVATADAVVVLPKSRAQDVKGLVESLEAQRRREVLEHRKCYRPWGDYESKDEGERYQVKRITVKPGARLSLQKHFHRSEHWIVVKGTAEVTIDGEVRLVHENESTYIPSGAVHRLANPGRIPLELIEVQVGSYLGEDDIVRLEDAYGRQR